MLNKFISEVPAQKVHRSLPAALPAAFIQPISDMELLISEIARTYYRLQNQSKTFRGPTSNKKPFFAGCFGKYSVESRG